MTTFLAQWGIDAIFQACLLGGLIGGGLRALSTWNQPNWSWRSRSDMVVGSLMAVFLPFMAKKMPFAPPELLANITPGLWFMASLAYGYMFSSLVTNWVTNYVIAKTQGVVGPSPSPSATVPTKEG